MKKIILFFVLIPFLGLSQVGIGTTNPEAGLDITSVNSGLLMPRVELTSSSDITTVLNPQGGVLATSTMVYNTATVADVVPGFYFCNATIWVPIGASDLDWTVSRADIYNANSGNVGVGTTAPSALFHIEDSTAVVSDLLDDGFEDSTVAPFTTGGDTSFVITTTTGEFNSGSVGIKSGNIDDDEESWLETTVNVGSANGATFTFEYKVDIEDSFDLFYLYIDGVQQLDLRSVVWQTATLSLTTGFHTIRWRYFKDDSLSEGADEIYLDDIKIKENESNPIFRLVDGNQQAGRVLTSDALGNASWSDASDVSDDDWRFFGSSKTEADMTYRTGAVVIGSNTITAHHLHVDNGSTSGTQIGIGFIEYIEDGPNLTLFSDSLAPLTDGDFDLGDASNRWGEVYSVNGVINTSDARLKDNIEPLNYGLKEVMSLKPVSYTWKKEQYGKTVVPENQKEVKLGFLAQYLQEVINEVVTTHNWVPGNEENHDTFALKENERLGVNYSEIIPVLVKAIQEQQIEINKLKAIINN